MNSELEVALQDFDAPPGSEHCGDLLLLRAIKARMFCMYMDSDSPYHALGVQLKEWLNSSEGTGRIRQGIGDPYPELRGLCGRLLILKKEPGSDATALQMLSDPSWEVRDLICETLHSTPLPNCEERLIELAQHDPNFVVRGQAAKALARYSRVRVIPVLLKMLETDHEVDHDPNVLVPPPSKVAASALDELLDTNWVETRLPGGFATFPPGPVNLDRLKEQANLELNRLRAQEP